MRIIKKVQPHGPAVIQQVASQGWNIGHSAID
jgi:hypothetical protein